jgi:hypothetical protein
MDPVIWAAIIAGGVSVVGNVATVTVALFGRRTHREQIEATASVERARIDAGAEGVRDQRREAARQERRALYGRLLAVILRHEQYGRGDPVATDDQYRETAAEYEALHAEVLLVGTEPVQDAMGHVLVALHTIGADMGNYSGGPAEQFRTAFQHAGRGDAVTVARANLIHVMRDDVTAPHL